jgi:hypothetical protein
MSVLVAAASRWGIHFPHVSITSLPLAAYVRPVRGDASESIAYLRGTNYSYMTFVSCLITSFASIILGDIWITDKIVLM